MSSTLTDERITAALQRHDGNIAAAARGLRCTRQTLYTHVAASEDLQMLRHQLREQLLDDCERLVYKLAKAGEAWALRYVLSSQGRHRGWSERYDPSTDGVTDVVIRVVYDTEPVDDDDDGQPVATIDTPPPVPRRPAAIHRKRGVLRRTDTHAE